MFVQGSEEINKKITEPAADTHALANEFSFWLRKFTKAVHGNICKCPLPASTPTPHNKPVEKMVQFDF